MARRYSYDLRMKIFKAVDDGLSIVKACKIFNRSLSKLVKVVQNYKCQRSN
ncbi:homeo-like domain protein [Orientia tsutsugamushi str. TA716]|uniref:Homeo-like domain protein n=1 Tax=Orientia tsutsugamushi str. TA716 TaxID=1359175 RepID=A0A0F3P9N8_ORITS|nr:homeo-like domain protein [Orientia tsutsugamushi str. TA716]